MEVEFVDRYSATGTLPPNPWTGCRGSCEGMGVYPLPFSEWEAIEGGRPKLCPQKDENDEWELFPPGDRYEHIFVYCEGCGGTGRRWNGRIADMLDLIHTYYLPFSMALFARRSRDFYGASRLGVIPHALRMFRMIWREQSAIRRASR